MSKQTRLLALLGAAAVLLAACGQAADSAAPDEAATQADASRPANRAVDFTFAAYQGADRVGSENLQFSEVLEQGKPVVLNFWAGLCPPCRLEMPDFQEVYEEFEQQVLVVGVDVGPFTALGSREDGRALVDQLGLSYPIGTTFDPAVLSDYKVLGMPTTAFITPEGEIVRSWTGLLTKAKMVELVEELLQASG